MTPLSDKTLHTLRTTVKGWAEAEALARKAHAGQTRKGTGTAYIEHPLRVAAKLHGTDKADDDTVLAGLLHDTVEDSTVTLETLKQRFGPKVARIVEGLTDKPEWTGLPGSQRKAKQAEHIATEPREVRLVKMRDQEDNLTELLETAERLPKGFVAHYPKSALRVCEAAAKNDLIHVLDDVKRLLTQTHTPPSPSKPHPSR